MCDANVPLFSVQAPSSVQRGDGWTLGEGPPSKNSVDGKIYTHEYY